MVMNFLQFYSVWAWYQVMPWLLPCAFVPRRPSGMARSKWSTSSAKRWLDVAIFGRQQLLWLCCQPMIEAPDIVRPSCQELHGFFPEFLVRKWLLKNRKTNVGFPWYYFGKLVPLLMVFISHSWWYKIRQPRCAYERGSWEWFAIVGQAVDYRILQDPAGYWAASGSHFQWSSHQLLLRQGPSYWCDTTELGLP